MLIALALAHRPIECLVVLAAHLLILDEYLNYDAAPLEEREKDEFERLTDVQDITLNRADALLMLFGELEIGDSEVFWLVKFIEELLNLL